MNSEDVILTPPEETPVYNLPLLMQGALAALCLLGVSSMSGASWLVYPAAGTLMYSVYKGAPVWRLATAERLISVANLLRYVVPLLGCFFIAAFLADAPDPLSTLGSLAFALLLGVATALALAAIVRLFVAIYEWAAPAAASAAAQGRLYVRLLWLSAVS